LPAHRRDHTDAFSFRFIGNHVFTFRVFLGYGDSPFSLAFPFFFLASLLSSRPQVLRAAGIRPFGRRKFLSSITLVFPFRPGFLEIVCPRLFRLVSAYLPLAPFKRSYHATASQPFLLCFSVLRGFSFSLFFFYLLGAIRFLTKASAALR